jgi:hypothetical protein
MCVLVSMYVCSACFKHTYVCLSQHVCVQCLLQAHICVSQSACMCVVLAVSVSMHAPWQDTRPAHILTGTHKTIHTCILRYIQHMQTYVHTRKFLLLITHTHTHTIARTGTQLSMHTGINTQACKLVTCRIHKRSMFILKKFNHHDLLCPEAFCVATVAET